MKLLKAIFWFYINSSMHVAFAVVAFSYVTFCSLDMKIDYTILKFAFWATILAYNFVKYAGFLALSYRRKNMGYQWIIVMSFMALIMVVYYMSFLSVESFILVIVLQLLTFFYAIPIAWGKTTYRLRHNLRDVNGIKVFIIAIVWTGTTVLLPCFEQGKSIQFNVMLLSVQRFLWVLVLMIPFEIRDLKDDSNTLGTLPQKLGVMGSKRLGYGMVILIVFLEAYLSVDPVGSMVFVIIALLGLAGLYFSNATRGKLYSSFWIEGIPILWAGLLLVLS